MKIGNPLPHKRARIEIIPLIDIMFFLLASFMLASLAMILLEAALPPVSEDVKLAHKVLLHGRLARRFWGLAVVAGSLVPIVLATLLLLTGTGGVFAILAALLAGSALSALANPGTRFASSMVGLPRARFSGIT